MTWIDDRLRQMEQAARKGAQIRAGAEPLFEGLWKFILSDVEEARQKGIPVYAIGHSYERTLSAPNRRSPDSFRPRPLKVVLHPDNAEVTATGDGIDLKFQIDLADGGPLCLQLNGQRISFQEVAARILDPLLFPELHHSSGRAAARSQGAGS